MDKEPRQKTQQELDADLRDEKTIEALLADVGSGWTISLTRIRPSWCKGWLETIDAAPDEKLDMEYIADTWGGETIRIRLLDTHGRYKGGKDFHVARPPMSHGRKLEHPDDERARVAREERQREKLEQKEDFARLNAIQPAQQDNSAFTLLVDVLKSANATNSDAYKELAKAKTRDPMGIDQIIAFANGIQDLQGVFGGGGEKGGEDTDGMLGAFLKIMDNANERDKEKLAMKARAIKEHKDARSQGARPRQLPMRSVPPVQPAHNPTPTTPAPPIAAAQNDPDVSEDLALSEELAELSPNEAVEVLGEAFTMMPIEKRQKVMKLMLAFNNAGNAADILSGDGLPDPLDDSTTEDAAPDAADDGDDTSFKHVGTET